MSTEVARANMISELSRLAEDFESTAAGLSALRNAERLMDDDSADFIDQLRYTSSQLRILARKAENSSKDNGKTG
ncbi:MAG TPA: hypothetical protein VGC62_25725 [Pseudomonas sp.]|uniref:hypothetical protein n=1 Tax=Pseudomonas sp. TaxID=306 RepID=UPI002EDA31F2